MLGQNVGDKIGMLWTCIGILYGSSSANVILDITIIVGGATPATSWVKYIVATENSRVFTRDVPGITAIRK